ncbi:uncharacterized protein LOC144445755 [Glandiceps talaboti]
MPKRRDRREDSIEKRRRKNVKSLLEQQRSKVSLSQHEAILQHAVASTHASGNDSATKTEEKTNTSNSGECGNADISETLHQQHENSDSLDGDSDSQIFTGAMEESADTEKYMNILHKFSSAPQIQENTDDDGKDDGGDYDEEEGVMLTEHMSIYNSLIGNDTNEEHNEDGIESEGCGPTTSDFIPNTDTNNSFESDMLFPNSTITVEMSMFLIITYALKYHLSGDHTQD